MIIVFALVSAFFGISYSAAPFKFSYRGLGEVIIGIMFGPLAMMGVFFAATGVFSFPLLYLSVAVGLLVSNIIYTHSILDIDADKEVNKYTLAVLIGNKKGMLFVSLLINILPFVIVSVGVILQHLSI
jgi:1,4-dihydroxy-2-naphthoate octaprenyltransferase